jgi:polyhydroxyalkanoate synthesis regulator phasin
MANNIALTFTVNGVEQTIKTIGELETAIRQAKEELSGLEIGTKEFDALRVKVRAADNTLKNLQETIEGKKIEETIGRYAKVGSAITGSFAAAQAAVSLFGTESEEVTKAAAQAQNLLTFALVGREVAEGGVAASTIVAELATKAQTASTLAADAATKRFYATLAANPYTAILVGIGLLVTAVVAFGTATDDSKKKSKELADQVLKDSAKEVTATKLLIQTVNDQTLSTETRKKALEDLTSKFPAYFDDLKQEDILSGKVKISTQQLTTAIIQQAQARALQGRIEENTVKQLDLEDKLNKATLERVKSEKLLRDARNQRITGGGSVAGLGGQGVEDFTLQNNLNNAIAKENQLRSEKSKIDKVIIADSNRILKLNQDTDQVIGTGTEEIKDNTDATKKNTSAKEGNVQATEEQLKLQKQLEDSLNSQIDGLEKTAEIFRKIGENQAVNVTIPKSLEIIRELRGAIDGLIPKKVEDDFDKIGLKIKITDGQFIELSNTLKDTQDTFGNFIELTRKEFTQEALKFDPDRFDVFTDFKLNEASLLLQSGQITKVAFDTFDQLVKQYKDFNFIIKELPENVRSIFTPEVLQNYLELTKEIGIATREIGYDKVGDDIVKVENSTISLTKKQDELKEVLKVVSEQLIKGYQTQLFTDGLFDPTKFETLIKDLVRTGKLTEEQGKKLSEFTVESQKDATKLINELADEQVKALNKVVDNIVKEENQIREFLFLIQEERKGALERQSEALPRVFLNNLDLLDKELSKAGEITVKTEESVEKQRENIIQQFSQRKIDLTKLTQEEIDKIIEFYLNKQIKQTEESTKIQIKRLENFKQFLAEFQGLVGQVSQLTTDLYSNELEKLDRQNEEINSKILGDSERANELRLEQEEIYNRKKKQLEKNAARTALQISLVQATANVAEAVTKALTAGPVSGQILAGISAAIGLVQVGVIAKQLTEVDSYQRGGIIKGQGGMVVGPSHEYGGVKFQNGGVELEGGEAVINRVSTIKYAGLLSQINQNGGGKPISVTNFDDSRILEALSRQKNEPLRAYVVESDITDKQQITRRLERLSQI